MPGCRRSGVRLRGPRRLKTTRGWQVFSGNYCINCHAVRGTEANSIAGPDLTHLASRRTLAAGLLDNNRQNLERWVRNPQEFKRGAHMPPTVGVTQEQFDALIDYLLTLD